MSILTQQTILFPAAAREAQAVFRLALDALARPGNVVRFPPVDRFPLDPARPAFALIRALADRETTLAVLGGDETVTRFSALTTGARLADFADAEYVLALASPGFRLASVRRGAPELPEEGATVVISVTTVGAGPLRLRLAGPGIRESVLLLIDGLDAEAVAARNLACADYPLGIDLFLVDAAGRCAAIPRTTSVTIEGA